MLFLHSTFSGIHSVPVVCPTVSRSHWLQPFLLVFMRATTGPISYSHMAQCCPLLSHVDIDGHIEVHGGVHPVEWFSWPSELPLLRILRPQLPVERLSLHPSTLIEGNVEVLEGEEEKSVERERVKANWALWDMEIE